MAPACSTAFPTIGSKITLMKPTDNPHESDAACNKFIDITLISLKSQKKKVTSYSLRW